jgi:DNA mismatch repair protein MutL
MQRKIRRLSKETMNQIAAGEVIENPASVVKELVENAIDADAISIRVEVEEGGFSRICVIDNGCGMSEEDLLFCFERHTTSKLESATDLITLRTLGFRGEALSSIAAVSRMVITSAMEEHVGMSIFVVEGCVQKEEIVARQKGTTLEVHDLFYNVPVRKKFQKQAAVSMAEITRTMTQIALAHPSIGFVLRQNGKEIFSVQESTKTPVDALSTRIECLLGRAFLDACLPCFSPPQFMGFIENPAHAQRIRTGAHLFVNTRPIHSSFLLETIRQAYGMRLEKERTPRFVLHMNLLPSYFDVNVHPQKREVRFLNEEMLKKDVERLIEAAFNHAFPSLPWEMQNIEKEESLEPSFVAEESMPESMSESPWASSEKVLQNYLSARTKEDRSLKDSETQAHRAAMPLELDDKIFAIGIFSNYLLLDAQLLGYMPGLAIVDLRAAEAALHYRFAQRESSIVAQGLLMARTMTVSSYEAARLEVFLEDLKNVGFVLRPFGKNSYLIEAIPAFFEEDEAAEVIREILHAEGTWSFEFLAKNMIKQFRKRSHVYTQEQGEHIVKELLTLKDAFVSPFEGQILRVIAKRDLV